MGYSCAVNANDTLDKIMQKVGSRGNVWEYEGKVYFYQIGREHQDGRVTGSVWEMIGAKSKYDWGRYKCKKVGSFCILPEGKVKRFDKIPKNILEEV